MDYKLVTELVKLFENDKKRDYSCVMAILPPFIIEKILAFGLNIPQEDIYEKEGYGRELIPHITILYGLLSPDPQEVRELFYSNKDIKLFQVTLGKISLFEPKDKDYDVVKIEVKSEAINKLNKLLSTLPNENEFPEFIPHITIAYVKKGKGSNYNNDKTFVGEDVGIDKVLFSDNTGKYKTVIELPSNENKGKDL